MSAATNELTRMVKARSLPAKSVIVEADQTERAALAKRFGLPAVKHLRAEVELEEDGKAVLARGTLQAEIVQSCAISGEDFKVEIDEPLLLRFVEEGSINPALSEDEEIEIELSPEDCDEIEYSGDSFDLGEAIAQSLGLAIDPYAEGPNADAFRKVAGISGDDEPSGSLAEALKGLKSS